MSGAAAPGTLGSSNLLRLGREIVSRLHVLLKTSRLYRSDNVNVRDAARALAETIRSIHAMEGTTQLAVVYDSLTLNDVRLKADITGHTTFQAVVHALDSRDTGAISFDADVDPGDLIGLAGEFHRVDESAEDPFGELREGLRRAGVRTIQLEPSMETPDRDRTENLKENLKRRSVNYFFQSIDVARQILTATDPAQMNFRKAKRVIHRMVDIMAEDESFLLSMSMIKNYDEYTFNHSANVTIYCIAFGQKIGLQKQVLADLGMAALFHDIGKTRVPRDILNKPGRLDEGEWEIMKGHAVHGAEMLIESRQLSDSVVRNILVAFEHHLNLDLGGYPALTDRRDLNLFSKIVAIADCFDALTTPRVYRKVGYSPQEAMSIMMEGRGTLFEPTLLKIFVNAVGVHPIGTLVELDTGEMGVVFRMSEEPQRLDLPYVKLFADATGERIPERVLDLGKRGEDGELLVKIVRSVDPADYFDAIEDYLEIL